MAKITGKTEFARRISAMGMTLVEFAKTTPFKKGTIEAVSIGKNNVSPSMEYFLKLAEERHKEGVVD